MSIKQRVSFILNEINQLPRRVTIPTGVGLLLLIMYVVTFVIEKPVQFSYAGDTCIRQISLFPALSKPTNDASFRAEARDMWRVGNVAVLSPTTCFVATKPPTPGVSRVSIAPFGGIVARKTFAVQVGKPPVARTESLSKPVPTGKPLDIHLSYADSVFDYRLEVGGKSTECSKKDAAQRCDIGALRLKQGEQYKLRLVRQFKEKTIATVATKKITTLTATAVTTSSVTPGQVIYDKPKSFTVEFDKPVVKASLSLEKVDGNTRTPITTTATFEGPKATLAFADELARSASYELSVDKLEAHDGSTLESPYKVPFTVSGGPKVTGVNVGSTGLPFTKTIVVTFDQALSDTQDITKFVGLKGVGASISKKDNQLFISYANAPKCTDFSITLAKGIESRYGIAQNDPWSFSTRTICYSTMTIGYSAGGRPITAYLFGSGARTVLYTGSIHGNEISAKRLMEAWINELEANARSIPADKQIVVVPAINLDGVAANRRNNNNNVDLNRNFDTTDWQKDITTPSNQPLENGGGTAPMSEPETRALATFTSQLGPRLTLSYHSIAGYAIANEAGDSASLAGSYAQMTGYRNMTGNGGAFDYSTSGTYDDWIAQKLGLPSILIELASSTNSEFSRNKAALWAMARS